MSLLDKAKKNIIRWHQQQAFPEEIKQLKNSYMQKEKQLTKKSGIYNLDPYLDKEGLSRVREDWKNQIFISVTSALFLLVGKAKQHS